MTRAEDAIAEALYGPDRESAPQWAIRAVIAAIRDLSAEDLAELIWGEVEWGVRHHQGLRPEPSEQAARESLVWTTANYERSHHNRFKPHITTRVVTPWRPADGMNGAGATTGAAEAATDAQGPA